MGVTVRESMIRLGAGLLALLLLGTAPALAQGLGGPAPEAKVRLLPAQTALGEGGTPARLALEIGLPEGFHTYWRSPGEGGIAPQVDWSGSTNLGEAQLLFPAPHRFASLDVETVGYEQSLMLPVLASAADPAQPLVLNASIFMAICSNICVPYQTVVTATLPPGAADATPDAARIAEWFAKVPGTPRAAGMAVEAVSATDGADGLARLEVTVSGAPLQAPELFVEAPGGVEFGAPTATADTATGRTVLTAVQRPGFGTPPRLPGDAPLRLTVVDGTRGFETAVVLGQPLPDPGMALPPVLAEEDASGGNDTSAPSLWAMLAIALLGGLVLNVMPCVLPVLSIKLVGLVEGAQRSRRAVRAGFLASAAGVLVTFWLLGAAAVALSAAGQSIAWGMQFQQPLFLALLLLVLVLFTLNLAGAFEIALPWRVQSRLARLGPQGPESEAGLAGHFATGMLATVLATPCSAPFVGTALTFAFLAGPGTIFAIFTALGLGLAAPYLLIAAMPSLVRWLPRPGKWMVKVRQVMAVLLALTALWLLWVLFHQLEPGATLAIAVAAAALALALLLRGRLPRGLRVALPAVLALALLLPAGLWPAAAAKGEASAHALDVAAIAPAVAEGRTVFVDVTAEWCVTCKVNKQTVLLQDPVFGRLADAGAVMTMEGDWTRADPAISRFLASNSRFGVPFNIVYGPGAPGGIILPELLTSDAVLQALDCAGQAPPATASC